MPRFLLPPLRYLGGQVSPKLPYSLSVQIVNERCCKFTYYPTAARIEAVLLGFSPPLAPCVPVRYWLRLVVLLRCGHSTFVEIKVNNNFNECRFIWQNKTRRHQMAVINGVTMFAEANTLDCLINNGFGMDFARREYSKTRIAKAGERISRNEATEEDWLVLANWRGVHTYVLNTFQCKLRRLIRVGSHELAQRLKRKNTIINKLATGRAVNLASMHDIAGCRVICRSLMDLDYIRDRVHRSRSGHEYQSEGRYDYLAFPKPNGYRGQHDVFSYKVNGTAGEHYNGLKVEIQYRTRVQHAWATALEISDFIDNTRIKFDTGANPEKERFFALASEYLARTHEKMDGPLPDISTGLLVEEMRDIEDATHIMQRLRQAHESKPEMPSSKNILLHFTDSRLEVTGWRSIKQATEHLGKIETEFPEHDVVYVRAENPGEVQSAFRNYFSNSHDFLRMIPKF